MSISVPWHCETCLLNILCMTSYKEKRTVLPTVCSEFLRGLQQSEAWEPLVVESLEAENFFIHGEFDAFHRALAVKSKGLELVFATANRIDDSITTRAGFSANEIEFSVPAISSDWTSSAQVWTLLRAELAFLGQKISDLQRSFLQFSLAVILQEGRTLSNVLLCAMAERVRGVILISDNDEIPVPFSDVDEPPPVMPLLIVSKLDGERLLDHLKVTKVHLKAVNNGRRCFQMEWVTAAMCRTESLNITLQAPVQKDSKQVYETLKSCELFRQLRIEVFMPMHDNFYELLLFIARIRCQCLTSFGEVRVEINCERPVVQANALSLQLVAQRDVPPKLGDPRQAFYLTEFSFLQATRHDLISFDHNFAELAFLLNNQLFTFFLRDHLKFSYMDTIRHLRQRFPMSFA